MAKNKKKILSIIILLVFIAGVAFLINYRTGKESERTEQKVIVKTDEKPNLIRKKIMLKDLKRFKIKPNEATVQKEIKHE